MENFDSTTYRNSPVLTIRFEWLNARTPRLISQQQSFLRLIQTCWRLIFLLFKAKRNERNIPFSFHQLARFWWTWKHRIVSQVFERMQATANIWLGNKRSTYNSLLGRSGQIRHFYFGWFDHWTGKILIQVLIFMKI